MARRFSAKNTLVNSSTDNTYAHGLGALPDEWKFNPRWNASWTSAAGSTGAQRQPQLYFKTINTTNILLRCNTSTTVDLGARVRADVFASINHSIVK